MQSIRFIPIIASMAFAAVSPPASAQDKLRQTVLVGGHVRVDLVDNLYIAPMHFNVPLVHCTERLVRELDAEGASMRQGVGAITPENRSEGVANGTSFNPTSPKFVVVRLCRRSATTYSP